MNWIQKFFTSIVPKSMAQSIEKSTREWKIECPKCSRKKDYWEAGGIRYKAKSWSKVQRALNYCSGCKKMRWLNVYREKGGG